MLIEFDSKIDDKDMYRFNMHHAYTSGQGILSIIVATVIMAVTAVTYGDVSQMDSIMYVCLSVIFLVFMPIQLKLKSKQQIAMSPVLQETLHFGFTEEGIEVSSKSVDDKAVLPWNMVYKVITTKHNLLIYSNKVNAYIVPKNQIEEQYPQIKKVLEEKVEDYRLDLKWV